MPTNRIPVRLSLLAASLSLVLLAGCTQDASTGDVASDASNQATDPLTAAAESAAQATDAGQASATSLKPNERVQGTIQFDMGNGPVSYRSIATKLDENLGRKTAERLGSADGQRALAKANDRAGGKVQVSAQDVQDMADTFAGKTIYTSEIREISIIKQRQMNLQGTAPDNSRVSISIQFGLDDDAPLGGNLQFMPNVKKLTQSYEINRKDKGSMQVKIDRFERVSDDTYAVAGTFTTGKLMPGVLAKDLAGKEIASSSGSFDFQEVHVQPAM